MNADKAAIILTALIELSPDGFLEELYDQGIDAMREYDTFLEAIEAIRDWIREEK